MARTPFEELQEKLTSAIKDNTKAQAEAMKSATVEGAEIRKLKKQTAAIEKKSAFLERDLGSELGQSLAAPFKSLTSIIPKPLKILASMPIQAAMRAHTAGKAPPPRVDASGTPMYPEGGKAFTEAMGREMSQKGYYKGAVAATAAKIPGMGLVSDKMMKSESKPIQKIGQWLGFSDERGKDHDQLIRTLKLGNENTALIDENTALISLRLQKIGAQLSGLGGGTLSGGPKKGTIMEHEGKTFRWEGAGRGGVGPQWSVRSEGAGATGKFLTGGKEGGRLVAEAGGNKALTAAFEEQLASGAMFGMDPDFYGGGPTSQLKATQIHSPEAEYRSEWMEALPTANTWLEKIFHVLDTSVIAVHSKSKLEETIERVFEHRRAEGYEHITGPTKESVAAQAGLTPEGFAQAWPEADIMQTTMSDQWGIFLKMATTKGSIYTHDTTLNEKVQLILEKLGISSKEEKKRPAREKETEGKERARDKREGKATSLWRGKMLGMFGGIGSGGLMGWLGGKAKAGGKALLGKGMGVAGKWLGGGMGVLGAGKVGASLIAAKGAAGTAAATTAAAGGGATTAAAAGGASVGAIAAGVVLPLAASAMIIKDAVDLFSKNASAEERWLKKGENKGGVIGGVGGMAGGALAGAAIGSVVPIVGTVIGGLIGAGVGGILGNMVGESIGKSLDKAVDKRTRAQLTALAQEFDALTEERKKINAAEMDLVTKKTLLLQNEARQVELERQAAIVSKREQDIKKAEAARLRYMTHANNIELHKQYIDMYDHLDEEGKFIKGQGKKAESYRNLKDEVQRLESEQLRLDALYQETYKTQGSEAADAVAAESAQTADALAKAKDTLTKLDMGAPVESMNVMMYEIQKKFAAADNALDTVDIKGWALFDEDEQIAEIVALQKKIERGEKLTKDEAKVAEEWNTARDKHFDQLKGTAKDKEDEANRLKAEREKGEGVDVDWEKALDMMEQPWKKDWREPSGTQESLHKAGESEADYRKRIGAPTSGVTGGAIYGMPMQGPAGRYYDTTGISQAPGPQSAAQRAYAAGTAEPYPLTTARHPAPLPNEDPVGDYKSPAAAVPPAVPFSELEATGSIAETVIRTRTPIGQPGPAVAGVSDYLKTGAALAAQPVEGKVVASEDKTALENELIKEGIEIQKRIAKSKGWFSNVYEGSDKEGRKIDQARLDEIKKQVSAFGGAEAQTFDPDAEIGAAQKGAVSDTTMQAVGGEFDAKSKITWITGNMGTLYFNEAQQEKYKALELAAKALRREAEQIKALAEKKLKEELTDLGVFSGSAFFMDDDDPRKAEFEAREKKIEEDAEKLIKEGEDASLLFLNQMKRDKETQDKLMKSWTDKHTVKKSDDAAAPVAAAGRTDREGGAMPAQAGAVSKTTTQAATGQGKKLTKEQIGTEEYIDPGSIMKDRPLEFKEWVAAGQDHDDHNDYLMEWEAATGKSYLTAVKVNRDKQYRAAKDDLANIPAAMMTAEERQGLQDTVTDYEKKGPAQAGDMSKNADLEQYKQDVVLGILGKKGLPFDPVQISKMKKAMVVTKTAGGYEASVGGGFMQNRYMTDSELKGMDELVQKLMKEQGLSYSAVAMGEEVGDYISQVSPTQRQAQAKTAVLNQGATTAAAQAAQGGGGNTNVTVVAPTTANSTTTNQNINPNPLMSQNPRSTIANW